MARCFLPGYTSPRMSRSSIRDTSRCTSIAGIWTTAPFHSLFSALFNTVRETRPPSLTPSARTFTFADAGRLVTPLEKAEDIKEVADEKALSIRSQRPQSLDSAQTRLERDIRWLWYEFTPYEVGCDEIGGRCFAPFLDMTKI